MSQEKEWWHPERLSESERRFRSIEDISQLDPNNDFGSYRRVLLGNFDSAKIATHNDTKPKAKVKWLVKALGLPAKADVLDAGCGLGYTTRALHEQFGSAVGVDVSEDAIAWASANLSGPTFRAQAIAPNQHLGIFDLIFCFEFYPFTRNADGRFQAAYLQSFAQQLKPKGQVVIYQRLHNSSSLSVILDELREALPQLKIDVRLVPNPKFPLWLPTWIALLLSTLISFLRRDVVKRVVTVAKRDC